MLKVFLGGEGKNEIGTRWQVPMGSEVGVVETLLLRVRPGGWRVGGAMQWQSIRKYRAGVSKGHGEHADARNVLGLVLHAYEEACEVLAFVRDADGDDLRADAIKSALEGIATFGFAEAYRYDLEIVGGVAKPTIEGWILCMLGVSNTDEMTKAGAARELTKTGAELKSTADYIALAENCSLPTGDGSLAAWLAQAKATFRRLIDGDAGA